MAGADALPRVTLPVHFSCPQAAIWPELRDLAPGARLPEDVLAARSSFAGVWITRGYYELRDYIDSCTIGPGLKRDAINISHAAMIGLRGRGFREFLVTIRADWHAPGFANFVILQNTLAPETLASGNVSFWTQPGIRPRDPARGTRIEVICFKGMPQHVAGAFRSEAFHGALADLGVTLRFDEAVRSEDGGLAWADYSDVDLTLAVRGMSWDRLHHKPANKLFNAWEGRTPALLGPEPAYQALRTSPLDYIEVETPEAVLAAVRKLKDDPDLYTQMVEHGAARSAAFSNTALVRKWLKLLTGPIAEAHAAWQGRSALSRALWISAGLVRERRNKKQYWGRPETVLGETAATGKTT
ncbi:glycosyltransferase [Roseobacter sp. A03A-229]